MFITFSDFKPSDIVETDEYIEFQVVAISNTCVKRKYGNLCFPEEVLRQNAKDLIGKPVLLDHDWSVEKIVGVVVDAFFDESRKAIVAKLRIPKLGHEKLISLIKLQPSPIQDVSIGAEIETEKVEDKYVVKSIKFKELSLVLEGADPNAKRIAASATCSIETLGVQNWWDDPELRAKAPKDYFLDPENRRYPYRTWEGEISCDRLKAAMSLASLHGHDRIYARAKTLYENHCKNKKSQ